MTDQRHGRTLHPSVTRRNDVPLDQTTELTLAAAIVAVARDLARSVPPPRGAPYFGLESGTPYDLSALDVFSTRGIFRKYEFALDIGSGLGGRARWLAARLGCRILGIESRRPLVAAAAMLNQRAHMDGQVSFQLGALDRLPLRERVFTHVWIVDALAGMPAAPQVAEAFRVLRRGGYFALQCPGPPRGCGELLETLRRVGFIEVETRAAVVPDLPHTFRLARDRLRAALRASPDAVTLWEHLEAPVQPPTRVQIFARRPA